MTLPPSSPDDEWQQIDSIVLSWIFATISEDIFQITYKPNATAYNVWQSINQIFHDNKESRILQLEEEFSSIIMSNKTVTQYCKHIKNIADGLAEVNNPIPEKSLVLQTLRGLPNEYQSLINVITHLEPFPSFSKTRFMLLLEEMRMTKTKSTTSHTALMATNPNSPNPSYSSYGNDAYLGRGRSGRSRGGCGWGRSRWQHNHHGSWNAHDTFFFSIHKFI